MADHPNRGKGNDRWTPEHDVSSASHPARPQFATS